MQKQATPVDRESIDHLDSLDAFKDSDLKNLNKNSSKNLLSNHTELNQPKPHILNEKGTIEQSSTFYHNNNYLKEYENHKPDRPSTSVNQAGYHINRDYESISLDLEID